MYELSKLIGSYYCILYGQVVRILRIIPEFAQRVIKQKQEVQLLIRKEKGLPRDSCHLVAQHWLSLFPREQMPLFSPTI